MTNTPIKLKLLKHGGCRIFFDKKSAEFSLNSNFSKSLRKLEPRPFLYWCKQHLHYSLIDVLLTTLFDT